MRVADCGSSFCKLLDQGEQTPQIIPTREILSNPPPAFDVATGHLGKRLGRRFIGELEALAHGSKALIDAADYTVVDVGSRDTKVLGFTERRLSKIEWNDTCGAATGFTIDLIGRYYNIDFDDVPVAVDCLPVTCGVFGIERIFDAIIEQGDPHGGIASYIGGIAANIFVLSGRPQKLYLSGGLCENNLFVKSLAQHCEVVKLGRGVLVTGLQSKL
jgi:activator of 2-hydroxyglutaryl-CoA dehydratase